jgi:arylsulfatase A-like enzyme
MKVIVLVVNHLQAGYLGCYGNDWIGTPAFDRLSAEGVVFDRHYAAAPDPILTRRGWRSGRYEFPMPPGEPRVAPAPAADLVVLLQQAGVATSLLAERRFASPDFTHGWDRARTVEAEPAKALEATLKVAATELKRLAATPKWLLWVELNALEPPWTFPDELFDPPEEVSDEEDEPGPEEASAEEEAKLEPLLEPPLGLIPDDPSDATFLRLQQTYAAAVRYVDAGLDLLFETLAKRKLLDDVVLIVTTDRGAVLGEHGMVGPYRPWLHEELIHLPLLVRLPGGESAGRHITGLTQGLDLMPTLLELFGVPSVPQMHGHGLASCLRGSDQPVRAYACAGLANGMALEWALRTPEWSFLLPLGGEIEDAPRKPQLYAQPEDRWEVNDLSQHHLELTEHFERLLRDFVRATQQPGPLVPPPLEPPKPSGEP